MNQQTQAKKEHEELPLRQINICRLCKQEIAKSSKKCHHCGAWQSQWWSWLVHLPALISFVLMCVAIAQLILGYNQLLEAQRQRVLASDALQRAKQAEDTATSVAKNLDKVQVRVREQEESIYRIVAKAEEQGKTIDVITARVKREFSEILSIGAKAKSGVEDSIKRSEGEPKPGP